MKNVLRKLRWVWINFDKWGGAGTSYFFYDRVYYKNRWTPFVVVKLRYV